MRLGIGERPFDVDWGKASWTMGFECIGNEEFFRICTGRFQPARAVRRTKPSIASSCEGPQECAAFGQILVRRLVVPKGVDPGAQAGELVEYGGTVVTGCQAQGEELMVFVSAGGE